MAAFSQRYMAPLVTLSYCSTDPKDKLSLERIGGLVIGAWLVQCSSPSNPGCGSNRVRFTREAFLHALASTAHPCFAAAPKLDRMGVFDIQRASRLTDSRWTNWTPRTRSAISLAGSFNLSMSSSTAAAALACKSWATVVSFGEM